MKSSLRSLLVSVVLTMGVVTVGVSADQQPPQPAPAASGAASDAATTAVSMVEGPVAPVVYTVTLTPTSQATAPGGFTQSRWPNPLPRTTPKAGTAAKNAARHTGKHGKQAHHSKASKHRTHGGKRARRHQPEPVKPVRVRFAQANIKSLNADASFATDLNKVLALRPDFITLNEAVTRTDAQITPTGYAAYRGTGSAPVRETPVLWRTDKWEPVATGTRYLTLRHVKWGIRAVNWVTVRNLRTGQTLSVISAHPAPTTRHTSGLLPVFVTRLGVLVHQLAAQGPVMVGGDFNTAYRSSTYPTGAFAATTLVPTYATFGPPPGGTGDHHGATIDYVFYQPDRGLTPLQQGSIELASDHDAVWARFLLDPPTSN